MHFDSSSWSKADGGEFTDDDEEVLTLFASQAAAAIANARAHRNERRARADLEALVETSPVGVAVFDAESGRPVSFNREVRRIVESLRTPGRPPEQLLEVISCRRADGREVSLSEFPLAGQLGAGETVRAEEMVLSVPGGRSVRTLVNATPIRSAGGAVESVVVTMQDLAPLDEIERMRTEFLSLVGHELREPLAAIKGSAVTLLEEGAELEPAEMRESTASSSSRPGTCAASSATCSTPGASSRARSRSRPSPRRSRPWWNGRGAPSWAAAAGTPSTSTCPPFHPR